MLRITRRVGERIILGDNVIIEVTEIKGQSVRIGIEAPRSLPIYREEIWLAVKEENRAAAEATPDALPAEAPSAAAGDHETPAAQTPEPGPGHSPEEPSGEPSGAA